LPNDAFDFINGDAMTLRDNASALFSMKPLNFVIAVVYSITEMCGGPLRLLNGPANSDLALVESKES